MARVVDVVFVLHARDAADVASNASYDVVARVVLVSSDVFVLALEAVAVVGESLPGTEVVAAGRAEAAPEKKKSGKA